MSTTVSRRMVMVKMKKTAKPHVPMRRRSSLPDPDDNRMVGEQPKATVMHAVIRTPAPRTWWQKAMLPAGITVALLLGAAIVYGVRSAPETKYARTPEVVSAPSLSSVAAKRAHAPRSQAYPASGATEPSAPQRMTADDESFRASGYVRKKVYLPNADGDCVVVGGLGRVVGRCLREQLDR